MGDSVLRVWVELNIGRVEVLEQAATTVRVRGIMIGMVC